MDSVVAAFDTALIPQVLRYIFLYSVLDMYFHGMQTWNIAIGHDSARSIVWGLFIVSIIITVLGRIWLSFVTKYAPEPYLDEVFHIPQAQRFCQGDLTWDDKITTPPGLYILSILFNRVSGLTCSVYHLRLFNVEMTAYVAAAAVLCRSWIEQPKIEENIPRRFSTYAITTGLHVGFFPVVFFFSGLYYTDVISTFVVLIAYANQLRRLAQSQDPPLIDGTLTFFLGVLALFMRQTNIFWVVVFMGGLEVVHAVKSLKPEKPEGEPYFSILADHIRYVVWRYSLGDIHDPPLNLAYPFDLILCVISIGIAVACNLRAILPRILPHLLLLATFVGFVFINGGVVLGDKANHVATLHFAQLLYIWPLFAFFSAPLFIPYALFTADSIYRTWKPHPRIANFYNFYSYPGRNQIIGATIGALVIALAIVRFNTIIHPFTLADNRHYMFYVFRYSILRAWWVRYALAPIYVFCAWLCFTALRGYSLNTRAREWIRAVFAASSPSPRGDRPTTATTTTTSSAAIAAAALNANSGPPFTPPPSGGPQPSLSTTACAPTSTALILLLATALSLVTAPLVEPRYFILPWVFWRLHVPAWPIRRRAGGRIKEPRLVAEIIWLALVNLGTMYVFLMYPFYWKTEAEAEDGSKTAVALLDGGRVQRFMW